MNMKVMKFGGISLRSEATRKYVYRHAPESSKTNKVVIVVSVMGRYPDVYVTDTLPSMGSESLTRQEKARPVSMGERLSVLKICSGLLDMRIRAYALLFFDCGILIDEDYDYAKALRPDHTGICKKLNNYDVLAVGGFIGISPSGHVTTLGRGGSDYSAVLLAGMLDLKEVDIYIDVGGVYDKDPKLDEHVIKYDKLIYDEMLSMKSRILHDHRVSYVKDHHIRIYLKGVFSTSLGTIVEDQILSQLMSSRINYWIVYKGCDTTTTR